MIMKNKTLGKGLANLLNQTKHTYENKENSEFQYININYIHPDPNQPRKKIDQETLKELVESIKNYGVLQPLIVQKIKAESYRIIAGERRWQASKIVGLTQMPVLIKEVNEQKSFEIALIENIQRENLNPIEEAQSYIRLIENNKYTQEDLAQIIGKNRTHISNMIRINSLPPSVKEKIIEGQISVGHAKIIVKANNVEQIVDIIIKKGLSVRQTEQLIRKENKEVKPNAKLKSADESDNNDITKLESILSKKLGTKVSIEFKNNKGEIKVLFQDFQHLDDILNRIG